MSVARAEDKEEFRMWHELQHSTKLPMKEDLQDAMYIMAVTLLASGQFLIITSLSFSCFFCVVLHPYRHILDILNITLGDV
jgi:hypothetical protein